MLDPDQFEHAVEEALEGLPPQFASLLENVAVVIEEEPSADDLELIEEGGELLGIFRGVPRTYRAWGSLPILPTQIAIFRRPILRVTRSRTDAVRQIRDTVIHELGHYFGLSDEAMPY
jgi:predicted Zn-dependent protease with MMP-like domain